MRGQRIARRDLRLKDRIYGSVSVQAGDPRGRNTIQKAELSCSYDFSIRLYSDIPDEAVSRQWNVKAGVESTVRIEPSDRVTDRTVYCIKAPADHDLRVCLDSDAVHGAAHVGGEAGVYRTVGVKPDYSGTGVSV